MKESIRVFSPATVANVACGFDVLGFALESPGDEIEVRRRDEPGFTVINKTADTVFPGDVNKNTAVVSLKAYLEHLGSEDGFEITFHSKIKPGSGIGSSSASAAASVFAVNELLGRPLAQTDLVQFAMQGEKAAAGVAHADNVAPALLGGFVLVRSYDPLDLIQIPYPEELYCTIIHPQIEVKTEDARKILRKGITLKDAVTQWGNIAGLIAGLMKGDYPLIGRSLKDVIIEPIRSMLIPGFDEVKEAALANGALGASISGSGPSMFALSSSLETAQQVAQAMTKTFSQFEIENHSYVSKINKQGPKIL
ncbi:homoserine kinase [Adhaeribacter aerolatus]|uniref:Homoserine kinase n=1 Tax=Adhaeribacter aerolatus TaxID=670289 RepID=A0A512B560_9BACT|nr:homoserine kinase [Adhaeribacter aerolatus]GEO07090.1 homoserine kinase [Adhaeribacter aerolatus]